MVALAALLAVLQGCSLRKNTAATRKYTAFITRYNIYYNGDEHYKETLKQMESGYEDDYSQLLFAHPADARRDESAPQPSGDFTRSIEKAQKAIQLRSIKKKPKKKSGKSSDPAYKAWMKRDEYNPFLHNAWMMMGRSQYNNGDFLGAAATFYYITRHFSWLPATVTEAKIWQARAYCAMGWDFEAENILTKIHEKELESNSRLREIYDLAQGSYWSRTADPSKAIPYLERAVKAAKGSQKSRLNFMLGQLYQRQGENAKAYQAYKRSSTSSSPYRTQINARICQSEVYSGASIEPEVKALRRMTRYDRNKDYLDQIYYAIGNLYLSRRDTANAIENYKLAAEKSTRNGIEKAIDQLALGRLYFETHRYELAQPCYSEAVPLLPQSYPGLDSIKRRSDVLDELAVYSQNVTLNDSLLRLSEMDSAAQFKVIDKIIADLKKKEEEEAERQRREEFMADQQANGSQMQNTGNAASAPTTFMINNDDSWYFYNTATRNAGRTEFQKRWGARKLEDDWRRRNKASFSFDEFENSEGDTAEGADAENPEGGDLAEGEGNATQENADLASDPHNREYYLRQIPSTPEEKQTANDVIKEGLYNIGLILKDQLEDYDAAALDWDDLLRRYPDNIYRLDVYYNMYMMYARDGRKNLAEHYRALILKEFPDSKYGMAMRDPAYIDNLRRMNAEQESLYEKAYAAYLDNRNDEVHAAYRDMMQRYPLSKIMPKFMFIDALSYVTENKPEEFRSTLKELLERYPQTDITPLASAYLKALAQGRKLHSGASNTRGMLWDLRLGNDSVYNENDSITFDLNPDVPQLLVLVYPTDEVNANQLLYDVAYHNFSAFVVRDFDLEQMNFGRLGLLLIKGFANFEELNHYRKVMDEEGRLTLPPEVRPVMISVENFNKLIHQGRSFEDYFRYVDAQAEEQPVTASPGLTDSPPKDSDGFPVADPSADPEVQPEDDVPSESASSEYEMHPASEPASE
ncbi:tetratricopeptide repeat protein [uncultured Muribaculum sp.]|nr:tetratricopeptide repeat protein [uncultured Muribaculum sp.]